MIFRKLEYLLITALLAFLAASVTLAQDDSDPDKADDAAAPETSESTEPETEQKALPDLDELLGLEGGRSEEDDAGASDVLDALDPNKAELDRALENEDLSEAFVHAVKQMGDAANLLELGSDPGLQTQRVQDEIVRRLEILIEKAEQSSQSSSSSQSSTQQQQQQQSPPSQQQPDRPDPNTDSRSGESNETATPPGGREGPLANRLDTAQAAWGSLPDRVRQVLLEGVSDQFSSMYKRMTEDYYRRLAEETSDK